ncbi:MAG: B12-binding domain-containing radical SAM protein [Anaerolineae bacterium]|nr:B12-binding domain-containing radical SAM protein [Anaerolineae bacterium]
MMKKVVLISPPNDFAGNTNVVRFTTPLAPPLGILALGSYLATHNVPVELIDVQMDFGFGLTRDAEKVVCQRVAAYLCDQAEEIAWIGISQISNSGSGIILAQEIHAALAQIPIVFGGYFPSSNYRTLLKRYPFITAIVRGDGEAAALRISQSLDQGRSFLASSTPNLVWIDHQGELEISHAEPMDVSELPNLDFRLLRNLERYQTIDLMTSRGCPFKCNYCLEDSMRPYAEFSPDWVTRQIDQLVAELPGRPVYIWDPIFGVNRQRTEKICQAIKRPRFTYAVESRVDVMTPDLVPTLREAGVEMIFLGIESASPSTLVRMNKVRSEAGAEKYIHQAMDVLRSCFENQLTPVMGLMLGFPGDDESDYRATLAFIQQVGRIHDQVMHKRGVATGFIPFSFYSKVYDGTRLAQHVEREYPAAILRTEPFIGERTVLSPSPGVDLDVTRRYQNEITRQGAYTPLALERLRCYGAFSMEAFLAAHPELIDKGGVIVLGDSLLRYPREFGVASAFMDYDKSKDISSQRDLPNGRGEEEIV